MPGNREFPGIVSVKIRRFFHPDYTVGMGIAPIHAAVQLADFTASEESHLALKQTVPTDADILFSYRLQYTVS